MTVMRVSDISNEQAEKYATLYPLEFYEAAPHLLAKKNPQWLFEYNPNELFRLNFKWLLNHKERWLCFNYPQLMYRSYPAIMAIYNPKYKDKRDKAKRIIPGYILDKIL